jgi:hypothetical protein
VVDILGAAALASSLDRRPDEERNEPGNENGTRAPQHGGAAHPSARTLLDRLLGKLPQ